MKARAPKDCKLELGDGRVICYRKWDGRGRPLVLLHGLLDSSAGWDTLAAQMTRPVIAFDLPGFGGSALPKHATIGSYAADIDTALRQLKIRDFILCGHSLGGAVAAALTMQSKEVNRLLLIAPAGFGKLRPAEFLAAPGVSQLATLLVPFTMVNPLLVNVGYAALISKHRRPSAELSMRLMAGAPTCASGASYAMRALSRVSRSPMSNRDLGKFERPVLAVWGRSDILVPRSHIEHLRQALPQAKVQILDDVAHHPQHEAPKSILEIVERFCAGQSTAPSKFRKRAKETRVRSHRRLPSSVLRGSKATLPV